MVGILPRDTYNDEKLFINDKITRTNRQLRILSNFCDYKYIDLTPQFKCNEGSINSTLYYTDRLDLNKLLAEQIMKHLNKPNQHTIPPSSKAIHTSYVKIAFKIKLVQ